MILKQSFSLILATMIMLNGCTSWTTVDHYPEVTDKEVTHLVLKNGGTLDIKEIHVEGDTLFGKGKRTLNKGWRYETNYWDVPVVVAVEDIQEIKRKEVSTGRTVLLVTGTVLVLGAVAGGVALAKWEPNFLGSASL